MRIFSPLYFMLIMVPQAMPGQTNVKITDVNFWLDNKQIIVEYNIVNGSPDDRFTIGLKFVTENDQVIIPKSVTGDIGKNIEAGKGKTISWDFVTDRLAFSGNLKAVITVIPSLAHSGGPEYALLSLVVPGLGGYFVEKNKVRSIITTIGTVGLMTYGIIEKTKANRYYTDYKSSSDIQDIRMLYDKANSAHHKYFIATRIAAMVWIADIVWVAYRGSRNKNEKKPVQRISSGTGFTLNCQYNELQLGYRITF